MFTDIVGFSRQMGSNEARMLRLLEAHNRLIQQAVTAHHGHVIKSTGDGFLVEFPSVVHAVQCAQQIQAQFRAYNAEKENAEQIHIRIGVHLGDIVVQQDGDVFGDGVNIASRLQALAEPDSIYLSDVVYRDVAKKLALGTVVSLGRPKLKNIAERFAVYALLPEQPKGVRHTLQVQRLKLKQKRRALQAAALVLVLGLVSVGTPVLKNLYTPAPAPGPSAGPAPTDAAPLQLPDKPSIVVLPFVNMSKDPDQEYFSDGLTEVLTGDLSKISSLFVIARNSAFFYKGKGVKVQDVSKELGVRYVLEGSVQKARDQVRINAQLIDAMTGGHLWAEQYDRPLRDIFALQDEIVQKIVTTLKLQLSLREQGIFVRKTTANPEAYDYWLRGVESFYHLTKEAIVQAQQMFGKAIALDPQYALAYVSLGSTYYLEWVWQWSQDPQTLEQAFDLAQKAITRDDALPGAYRLLSRVYLCKRQYESALAAGERAVALDPNDADGYITLAERFCYVGQPEEAIRLIEKAMRLNPRYPVSYLHDLGWAYYLTRRYEEAIVTLNKVLVRNPNFLNSHLVLAAIYAEVGREAEAQAEAAEALRLDPNFTSEGARRTWPYKDPTALERDLTALRKAGLK